ncbi:MAG: serine/threonine protein kinase [Candidatus Xenobiia bacterium LiM19]
MLNSGSIMKDLHIHTQDTNRPGAAVIVGLLISLFFLPGCSNVTPPPKTATATIRIDTDRKGKTWIFYRNNREQEKNINTGQSTKTDYSYKCAGEYDTPCQFPVEPQGNYDIKVEKNEFPYKYRGEKRLIGAGEMITITMDREFNYGLVLPPILLALLIVYEYIRRNKVKAAMAMLAELKSEQLKTQEAEKRAEITTMSLNIPDRIGEYKVRDMIGKGGMAVVYKVESPYGDIFALKVPLPHVIDDEEFMKRFRHEATIGQSLNHPYITRLYDFNSDKAHGVPFICMEYVEGQSLASIIKDEAPLEGSRVMRYVKKIAEGLDYAHSKGIVHRDIKPANIMVGIKKSLKIMDFGIAKATDLSRMTQTDTILGTPMYMAPEQIDSKEVDLRADLYALGVVFYELATGELPFNETEPLKIVMEKIASDPVPPRSYNSNISPNMEKSIMKLLSRSPEDRYQSSAELLKDLEEM